MQQQSPNFTTTQRLHIGLPTTDINAATQFYSILLGTTPSKQRPGYAKFETTDPSVNLSLNQVKSVFKQNPEHHFGIQVKSAKQLQTIYNRLTAADIQITLEQQITCCYAKQDKIWATDPDGHPWEVFMVLDEQPDTPNANTNCCQDDCCTQPSNTNTSISEQPA